MSGSIFDESNKQDSRTKNQKAPKSNTLNKLKPKPRFRLSYPIVRDITLGLLLLVAFPLEMFASEIYKPSTWIGTRLGQMSGQQESARADDQIEVINRTEIETAKAKAQSQATIVRDSADAHADAESIRAGEQADMQLIQQARLKAELAEIDQQVQISNACENKRILELHQAELDCETTLKETYGVCQNRVRIIRERQCPALPDPSVYPENLRDFAKERVEAAKSNRERVRDTKT